MTKNKPKTKKELVKKLNGLIEKLEGSLENKDKQDEEGEPGSKANEDGEINIQDRLKFMEKRLKKVGKDKMRFLVDRYVNGDTKEISKEDALDLALFFENNMLVNSIKVKMGEIQKAKEDGSYYPFYCG